MRGLHRHVPIRAVGFRHSQDDGVVARVDPGGGRQEVHVGVRGGRLCVECKKERGKDKLKKEREGT